MILDTRTLFVIFTLVTVFMSVAMFFFWRVQKTYDGFAEWVLTAFFAAICYVLYLLRGVIPDFLSIFAANAGIPAVLILRLQGTRKYFGRPSVNLLYLLILVGVFIWYAYFLYADNNIQLRTFMLSLSVAFMTMMLSMEFYLNRKRGNSFLNITISALNLIYGAIFLTRGIIILKTPDYIFLKDYKFDTFFFILAPLFEIAWNVLFMMLNSQRTEEELKMALTVAEDASKAKSRFLGVMSHEMRTPLHAIRGATGMLEQSGLDEKQMQYATLLKRSSNILQDLLDEALDLTRIEAGRMELKNEAVELSDVLDDINDLFYQEFQKKGVDLIISRNYDGQDVIICDRRRLLQILTNLVGNSLKYTSAGSVKLALTSNSETDGLIEFRVTDTGTGISPKKLETIFEPFSPFLDSDHRQSGGIGLGLSIVKSLCELMGGHIRAESEPGKGSSFIVTLPARKPAKHTDDLAPKMQYLNNLPPLKILAVDDVPENLELLRFYLENSQIEIIESATGEDALEKLTLERFDCVLLDMQLPGLSGAEVVKSLRESEAGKDARRMPVIGISANAYEKDKVDAISVGCNMFITRPFSRQDLFWAISQLTGGNGEKCSSETYSEFPPEMLERARNRIKECLVEIAGACGKKDMKAVQRLGHSIKGLGRTFGFASFAMLGEQIETEAGKDNIDNIRLLTENLSKQLNHKFNH
jgi:signal transduction histidine kinase/DNA-binding NarL/FixJ family response regulator